MLCVAHSWAAQIAPLGKVLPRTTPWHEQRWHGGRHTAQLREILLLIRKARRFFGADAAAEVYAELST